MSTEAIRGTTQIAGVFGYPISHSASPAMHNAAFTALSLDWVYLPFAVKPESIRDAVEGIRALGIRGVNVTVPLKELIPPLMDVLTPRARALGSVNTVVNENGRLTGDSTDGPGFLASLEQAGLQIRPGSRAVVLGAGGSGRAIAHALAVAGADVIIANRTFERADILARDLSSYGQTQACILDSSEMERQLEGASLLVNTTSVGMYPHVDEMPEIPAKAFHSELAVFDLIYNPEETRLLRTARERGCRTLNGIEMLVRQGALSFTQWTGVEHPPIDAMRAAVIGALRTF